MCRSERFVCYACSLCSTKLTGSVWLSAVVRCCQISFCTHFVCPKSHESIDVLWCLLPLTLLCVVFDITSKQNDLSKITNANKIKNSNNKNSHAYVNNTGIFAHTHTYWLIVCKPLLVYSRCAKYSIDFVCYRSPNAVVELSIFHVCLSFTWYRIQFDEKCISHFSTTFEPSGQTHRYATLHFIKCIFMHFKESTACY